MRRRPPRATLFPYSAVLGSGRIFGLLPLAAQVFQKRAIDDAKFQAELVAHLVAPLHLQRGRTDNQYLARTMTYNKLLADKARLNGLAQADIISNQQCGPRHLDDPHVRSKLTFF